jgi:N-acetyltransferase
MADDSALPPGAAPIPPEAVWPPPRNISLIGATVTLAIATEADVEPLFSALDDDQVWQHVRGRPATPTDLAEVIAGAQGTGRHLYVVRLTRPLGDLPADSVVGTTSLFDGSIIDARCEIGFTLYRREVWGTAVNPECKLLLLNLCFQGLRMGRVQLKTDALNDRSQRAIASLGAQREGVLRRLQRRADGTVRDTVMYSVLAEEWPEVRGALRRRLGQA